MAKNKTINMVKSQVIYKDYSKDAERTALVSGENLAHMFGKIARWYTDISWVGHTHTEANITDFGTYAGASTKGGAATSANKLNIGSADIGSETKPVYFSYLTGKPVACTYSLNASVPANAVFTDINVKQSPSTADESREVLFAGNTGNTETTGTVGKSNKLYFNPSTGALTATSFSGSLAASNLTGTIDAGRLPTTAVTAGSYGPAAGGTLVHGGTFDVGYVTVDKYGRLTGASTKTFTLPAQYVHPTYTSKTSGLYKITVDSTGHVSGTAAVTAADLPAHTHPYIPLSGSMSITGKLRETMGETAGAEMSVSNGTYIIGLHVGTGGVNHGIYDFTSNINTWMCYHNGTEFLFNGKANTAGKWTTARTITIGSTGKSVDGSGNVSWSLSEIGAAASSHTHNYIPNTQAGMITAINLLGSADGTPVDGTYYISQHNGSDGTNTNYYRRTHLALWNYIKGKADSEYAPKSHSHSYLPLSGGTLTGILTLPANLYNDNYALDCNNSNIIGANAIKFADNSDNANEGIMFYRSSTTWDSVWASSGVLYFTPNHPTNTTNYTVYHSGNLTYSTIGAAAANHTHSYAKSESVNGPAYCVAGWEGTDAIYRHVWFSTSTDETRRAYNDNFMCSPTQGTLKFTGWIPIDLTGKTDNLNSYNDSTGVYRYYRCICTTTGGGNNISNKPVDSPFVLEVILIRWASATDYITKQIYHGFDKKTYQRFCTNGTWSTWTEQKYTDTVYTHPTYTSKTSGLYKITVDSTGHVSGTAAVTASDLPSHTHNYVLNTEAGVIAGINLLREATAIPVDDCWYISQENDATTTNFYKRKHSALWSYINGKISYSNTGSGNAVTSISYSNGVITATKGSTFASSTHSHGTLYNSFVSTLDTTTNTWAAAGLNGEGHVIKSIRTNTNAPAYLLNDFSAGIGFGGGDTRGVISVKYDTPIIRFAGGNRTATDGGTARWYFTLAATSAQTYTFPTTGGALTDIIYKASNYYATASHTHSYLPLSGGTMSGLIMGGRGYTHLALGTDSYTNDYGGLEKLNNVDINTWYGFSVSNACTAVGTLNQVAFSVNARTGNVYARTGIYVGSTKVSLEGHTHSYLPLSGGTLTGALTINTSAYEKFSLYRSGSANGAAIHFYNDSNSVTKNLLGSICMTGNPDGGLIRYKSDNNTSYTFLDTGNFSISRSLTSGTKIATLTYAGNSVDLYCQTNTNTDVNVTQEVTDTTNYRNILAGYTSNTEKGSGRSATVTGKVYDTDLIFMQSSTGNLYARNMISYNHAGGDAIVEWNRNANASWRIINSGAVLRFQCDWTTKKTSYYDTLILNYNNSSIQSKASIILDDPNSGLIHKQNSTSNYTETIRWWKGGSAPSAGTYPPQIGQHNTGDTDGAICILPYQTTSDPWNAGVGLYISKTRLLYKGTAISLSGHTHNYAGSSTAGGDANRAVQANNCKVNVTDPSSSTPYGIVFVADPNTTEDNTLRKSNNFRINHFVGAANTEGIIEIVMGNTTAKTAANNSTGRIAFYNSNGKYTVVTPGTGSSNVTVTLPTSGGTLALVGDNNHTHNYVPNTRAGMIAGINLLDTATAAPTDDSYYIAQENDASTTNYYRRKHSAIWSYIKGKADSVYAAASHSHSYLPLSGGALTGNVSLAETKAIILRPNHSRYTAGIGYDTSGNECIAIWAKNSDTRLRWNAGTDMSTLTAGAMMNITPDFEISKASGSALGYIAGNTIIVATAASMSLGINALSIGTSTPSDGDYYVAQYANGGTTTTSYHRRLHSALYEYIRQKLAASGGFCGHTQRFAGSTSIAAGKEKTTITFSIEGGTVARTFFVLRFTWSSPTTEIVAIAPKKENAWVNAVFAISPGGGAPGTYNACVAIGVYYSVSGSTYKMSFNTNAAFTITRVDEYYC